MSKYRDHRDQRRHRRHDQDGRFSERTSEPSYFQRPPVVATEPVDAEVLWFNASKGFGFVKLPDDTQVYMHMRALESVGSRDVFEGTPLKVRVEETPRGRQVAQVLEICVHPTSPAHSGRTGAANVGNVPLLKTQGTVKFYDPARGFGFIVPSNGDKDVFVHATALARSGLSGLMEGQKVFVECGQGKKGLEVQSIRLAKPLTD